MKNLPLFLLIFICSYAFSQETYYVVHTYGEVKNSDNEKIEVRDKISTEDKLTFSTDDDFLVVFSSTSGRKVIRPRNKAEKTSSSFITYFVKENLFPLKKGIPTRGLDVGRNNIADLMTYFDQPLIIIRRHEVPVEENVGFNEQNYLIMGEDIKIPMTDSSLVFDKSLPAGTFPLFVMDEEYGMKTPTGRAVLIHKSKSELMNEMKYYQELIGKPLEKKEIIVYLEETLGVISEQDLAWLLE